MSLNMKLNEESFKKNAVYGAVSHAVTASYCASIIILYAYMCIPQQKHRNYNQNQGIFIYSYGKKSVHRHIGQHLDNVTYILCHRHLPRQEFPSVVRLMSFPSLLKSTLHTSYLKRRREFKEILIRKVYSHTSGRVNSFDDSISCVLLAHVLLMTKSRFFQVQLFSE